MKFEMIIVLAILVLSSAASGLDVSMGVESGGVSSASSSTFSLDSETRMTSQSDGWSTVTDIKGSGMAAHNGLFISTDDKSAETSIVSAGQDVSIVSSGIEVAAKSGDVVMGTDMLNADGTTTLAGPLVTPTGGNPGAYTLIGYRWNQRDPQLKWVLKTDSYLAGEGISSSSAIGAIMGASNTWDAATNQNLFADSGLVGTSSTVVTERYNKINTISFKPFPVGSCLAYAKTYYSLSNRVDGYKTALDSDLVFNTKYNWRTDSTKSGYDFQSVALHEMGHTLGLGDLYGLTQFKYDRDQVMHYYTGVKRTLGNGDAAGIWELYG